MKVREAPFALRVVRRREGNAAIVYRRRLSSDAQENLAERLERVAGAAARLLGGLRDPAGGRSCH